MPTKSIAQREREAAERALEEYKQKVLDVARRAQTENGWCERGFAQAMEELEIDTVSNEFTADLTIVVRVSGEAAERHKFENSDELVDFISSSIGAYSAWQVLDSDFDVTVDDAYIDSVELHSP